MPMSSGGRGKSGGCCPSKDQPNSHPDSCACKICTSPDQGQEVTRGPITYSIPSVCTKNKKEEPVKEPPVPRPSIMDILRDTQDCHCGVIARAVASHVHTNLGLTNTRHLINNEPKPTVSKDNENEAEDSKKTEKASK